MCELSPPRGGASINQTLKDLESEITTSGNEKDILLTTENERLSKEREKSSEKFKKLEEGSIKTQSQSHLRKGAGMQLTSSDKKLRVEQAKQNYELTTKRNNLQDSLQRKTVEFKQQVEKNVASSFQSIKSAVQSETRKLEKALDELRESNKKLIERVKNCIQELPQSIFVQSEELINKNYCDYVEERKQSAST